MNNTSFRNVIRNSLSRRALFMIFGYILIMIILAVTLHRFVDREWLQNVVQGTGQTGIIVFALIEYFYVIFVPVYNTAIHLAAGYVFGGHVGWILNFIATSAGLFTIIALVKHYGRPLIEKVVSPRILERYDGLAWRVGPLMLFFVYVLPVFPDDEITYLVAASQVQFRRFILPVLLGNVTKSAVSYIGDQGAAGIPQALGSRVVVLVVGVVLIGIQEYVLRRKTKS